MTKKFCVDCRWAVGDDGEDKQYLKCSNPKTARWEQDRQEYLVTGELSEPRQHMYFCSTIRMFRWPATWVTRNCGVSARFWEPKK